MKTKTYFLGDMGNYINQRYQAIQNDLIYIPILENSFSNQGMKETFDDDKGNN
jgi:hypothetical protein